MNPSAVSHILYKTKPSEYKVHYHVQYEIIFVACGECRIQIGDSVYTAKENDIVLISNLENHTTTIVKEPYFRYVLHLDPVKFDKKLSDATLLSMLKNRTHDFCHCLTMENTDTKELFKKLMEEFKSDNRFKEDMLLSYVRQILIQVFRRHPGNFALSQDKTKDTIFKVQTYLDDNFKENIKIEEVSEQFFLNKYYLSHMFKEVTGHSPKQYLTLIRLNNALRLLLETELSVTQICYDSGFSDVNNFLRLFKSRFKTTPGQYRKENK